jgi:hypothetical protein
MITMFGAPCGAVGELGHAGTESVAYLPIFPVNVASAHGNAAGVEGRGHALPACARDGIAATTADAAKAAMRLAVSASILDAGMKRLSVGCKLY